MVDGQGENGPIEPFKIMLSTRATNPEGILERDIKEREQRDQFPCYNYKKRKLFQLSTDEIQKILDSCLKDYLTQDETARKHRVSRYLVSKLVCQARREPEKLRERKDAEKDRLLRIKFIKKTAGELLDYK